MAQPWERDWQNEAAGASGGQPWEREWWSDGASKKRKPEDRGALDTAGDYAHATSQAFGEVLMNIQAGLGTFVQAPVANLRAAGTGALALADRGVTSLLAKGFPVLAGMDPNADPTGVQATARQASRDAAAQRAENVDAEGGSWLNPRTMIARVGLGLEQDARARAEEIQRVNAEKNPELVRQQQEVAKAEGFVPTVKAMAENPLATTYTLARSAPDMIGGLALSKAAAGRAMAGATTAADTAAARVAAAGGDIAAQGAAAKAVIDQAATLAVARASTTGTLAEAASSANSAREGVYREVMGLPAEKIKQSPRFQEILRETGGDALKAQELLANELADQAPLLTGTGTLLGSAITHRLFGGDTTAKAVAGQRMGVRDVVKNIAEEGTEESLQGIGEDAAQFGASEQADPSKKFDLGGSVAQNMVAGALMGGAGTGVRASQQAVQARLKPAGEAAAPAAPGAGPAAAAVDASEVLGAAPGAGDASIPEGGGPGAGQADSQNSARWQAFPPESGTLGIPRAEMPQIDAQHRGALVNFLEARGVGHEQVELDGKDLKPTQAEYSPDKVAKFADEPGSGGRSVLISSDGYVLDGHHQWVGSIEAGQPVRAIRLEAPIRELLPLVREFPSAGQAEGGTAAAPVVTAERALLQQNHITALDRVHEIDGQLAARAADDPMAAELRTERAQITKNWPQTTPGADTTFTTEAGARVGAQYALVNVGDLVTSHSESLRPNEAYPQALQPRQRERAASAQQINGIVQKLDPARLGQSADAATGAPIIGADGIVESGNARSISLKRIYTYGGQKAADYKAWLREHAHEFGLTPEAVDAREKPVLVRVRTTPVDRAEFARQANASTVAQMSPAEQARSDANRIDAMDDLQPDEQGDFATSRDFIRRFVARLPVTEQAGMVDAAGHLSSAGYARVRNAVLAKAYGDSPVLTRMVESMDDRLRNISRALMIAAPTVAQARAAIGAGALHDIDVTPHLVEAVDALAKLKEQGMSVEDALAQAGIFGEQYSPETRTLLAFLGENTRRPRRIAEFIKSYFEALDAVGDPRQDSLLGEQAPPEKADLMAAARRTTEGAPDAERTETAAADTQRRDAATAADDRAADRGQPQDEARDRGGDQGDGAAGPARFDESTPPQRVVNAIDAGATPEQKVEQLQALTEENKPIVQALIQRIDEAFGTKSSDNVKAPENILSKSTRPSILLRKPWFKVEHIRDSYRFKTVLQSVKQLPDVVRMVEAAGINIVKRDVDKVLQPGEWGWRIAAFDLQMPNGQLVEFYLPVAELEGAKKAEGHQLFEDWRNTSNLTKEQEAAMAAAMQRSRDLYQAAWDAYLARTGDSLTDIRASLSSAAASEAVARRQPSVASSPSVTRTAGEDQRPNESRDAENGASNTKAASEPSSSTYARSADADLSTGSILPPAGPKLSTSAGTPGGIGIRSLLGVVGRVAHAMPGLPQISVLQNVADAPKALRDEIAARGATAVEGAFHNGKIYLFAENIADEARAEHVLAEHEAAHAGLAGMLGAKLGQAMQALSNNNAAVRKAANALQQANPGMSHAEAVEEVIVDMPSAELARLKGWRGLVDRIRNWLASSGFTKLAEQLKGWLDGQVTQQQRADLEVAELVRAARDYVRRPAAERDTGTRLSSAATATPAQQPGVAERAEALIHTAAGTPKPIDAVAHAVTKYTGIERAAGLLYGTGAKLIDRLMSTSAGQRLAAGFVSDYGVPEAVIDQRAMMQGRQREQLRGAGTLLEKLATMTRAESRVAYEWMNESGDTARAAELMKALPPESVQVLQQVRAMIDQLSQEAVRLGQLDADAFDRHRFAYLRRSYFKHAVELQGDSGEKAKRQRSIAILGDQYKGRGMTAAVPMKQIQNMAPDWWKRKLVDGKADTALKGEQFVRLERRAPTGEGTAPLEGMETKQPGKLLEVHYFPAGEQLPSKYADWDNAGSWEVRDTKGGDAVMWRDFSKAEREKMGEIDEARFAIAKTLQGMIHDIEVGRYLEWLATYHAKKSGDSIPDGKIVEASERYRDTFKPDEWVQVPDAKIQGTQVAKYGKLAGRYLPGPIWNDLRQVVNGGRIGPEWFRKIMTAWKTSKTALSPAVHTNNVMSNFVMADWHDVSAGHIAKALRIVLGSMRQDRTGALGTAGNTIARGGIADREAAAEIMRRYQDSGGAIGSWATQEIRAEQLAPIVKLLQAELETAAEAGTEVGIFSALQHALHARFPNAVAALNGTRAGRVVVGTGKAAANEAGNLIDLYQSEDEVFRLAKWLKEKEAGATDAQAGKAARQSFLDYSINAPWVALMRATAFPFISFTYRALPMLLHTAGTKPHKLMKLMALAGALNYLGVMLGGGGDDKERKLLPEEKAGGVWGLVPKLIRMPWNDSHGSPVYLDIRRWIPVGDVVDLGQGHSAVPIPPSLMPGGPLAILGEVALNRAAFTGKDITKDTDTTMEKAAKVADHLWKAAAPNLPGLPGTYATQGIADALKGRTDAFGRELSLGQAALNTVGIKVGSYPADALRRNIIGKMKAEEMEIDKGIADLKRQRQTNRISPEEFAAELRAQQAKKVALQRRVAEQLN